MSIAGGSFECCVCLRNSDECPTLREARGSWQCDHCVCLGCDRELHTRAERCPLCRAERRDGRSDEAQRESAARAASTEARILAAEGLVEAIRRTVAGDPSSAEIEAVPVIISGLADDIVAMLQSGRVGGLSALRPPTADPPSRRRFSSARTAAEQGEALQARFDADMRSMRASGQRPGPPTAFLSGMVDSAARMRPLRESRTDRRGVGVNRRVDLARPAGQSRRIGGRGQGRIMRPC